MNGIPCFLYLFQFVNELYVAYDLCVLFLTSSAWNSKIKYVNKQQSTVVLLLKARKSTTATPLHGSKGLVGNDIRDQMDRKFYKCYFF